MCIVQYSERCTFHFYTTEKCIANDLVQMIRSCHVSITAWAIVRLLTNSNPFLYLIKFVFWKKTRYILINYDAIFPIQSSEFTKSLNFGSNLKKSCKKKSKIFNFLPKDCFFKIKNIFSIWNRVYSVRSILDLSDGSLFFNFFSKSKDMMKKLLKITEIARLPKKV